MNEELLARFRHLCDEKKWVIPREHQETIVQFLTADTLPKKEVARVIEETIQKERYSGAPHALNVLSKALGLGEESV